MTLSPQQVPDTSTLLAILRQHRGTDADFFIVLNGGVRSSKRLGLLEDPEADPKVKEPLLCVHNLIDDSEQELRLSQLFDASRSNIGEAIVKGAFFYEPEPQPNADPA